MRLTDEQVKAFRRRKFPHLEWDEPFDCPATVVIESRKSTGVRKDGTRFTVESPELSVTVVNLKRKLIKGEGAVYRPTEIKVVDLRPETLLRKSLPVVRVGKGTDHSVKPPTRASIEKARIDGAYTDKTALALTGPGATDPGEGNPPDWQDKGAAERELKRQEERRAEMSVERHDAEVDRAAIQLKRIGKRLGRKGVDLTPTLAELYERLAKMEKDAA